METLNLNDNVVIFDVDDQKLIENKIFIPSIANKVSHTILPVCFLQQKLLEQNIKFITPDIFFNSQIKPKKTLLISHVHGTSYTEKLIASGVKPIILTCQESPFIATRFYINLKKYSKKFSHSFLFLGMKSKISKNSIYHQMFFPQTYTSNDFKTNKFEEKKLLTLISSAKNFKNWKKNIILKILYGTGVKIIYKKRIEAINYYSSNFKSPDFDFFGYGWDESMRDQKIHTNAKINYHGTVENKIDILRNYKFSFCFENAVFPGYVTEKIFDSMIAGCVPIYLGAPDINKYVNENSFIDMRSFKNFEELTKFLKTLNEKKYNTYLNNIRDYFVSENYKKFSQESYAKQIIEILKLEFTKYDANT